MSIKNLHFDAVIFDMDGVITKTASVHAAAWKAMFDEFLRTWSKDNNEEFVEFTYEKDYLTYVDGKPRYKGVESFLSSRNIHIPFGSPDDSPQAETVCGLGNRKNEKLVEVLNRDGIDVYDSTVKLIHDLKAHGVHIGVASSSKNCELVLKTTGLEDLFETRVDGVVSAELGLRGKPQGDIFTTAAQNLGSEPSRAVVVEDAVSGVQAGRNGGFKLVIGLARENNQEDLEKNGADVVLEDLKGVDTQTINEWIEKNK